MKVSGHQIEWSYESIAAWPYAYWAYTQGVLTETESGPDSSCVYWYSPKHTIRTDERCWANMKEASDLPNLWIHKPRLDKTKWIPPPLKEHFKPNAITFDKPTVVIANRANKEWDRGMINFFDLPTLRSLFDMLQKKYQVVYLNVRGKPELEDTAKAIDIGDYDMIRKDYPGVKIIHDLIENDSFNETQFRIFAGCERFITMNGGYATTCSYFGGENIIYSKECRELWPNVNSFYNWYPDFGNANIKVVNNYDDLLDIVKAKWVDEKPLINILVRTHNREQSFDRMFKSIQDQGYKNWRVIASYDNEQTWKYLQKYPCDKVFVEPTEPPGPRPNDDDYRGFLASNLYLNTLAERVTSGYVTYMDDDDFYNKDAFASIAEHLNPYKLTIWKALTHENKVIPRQENWGKVVAGGISGITFAFHHKHLHKAVWEPWRRGDYRVIKSLHEYLKTTWVDYPLSVIGKKVPEKATVEYIAMKAAEHKVAVDLINAKVAAMQKNPVRKNLAPPPPVVENRCPHCGHIVG